MVSLIRAPTTLTSESKALKQSSLFVVAIMYMSEESKSDEVCVGRCPDSVQ